MPVSEILVLLRPEYLSKSHTVTESNDKLHTALNLLRQALAETSHECALVSVNQALEIVGSVEVIEAEELLSSKTSLEPGKIDDYDQFFRLKHVQARDPAECLVASVLTAYRALLELNHYTSIASAKVEVEAQKIGFTSCVNLLTRAFNLSGE